MFYREVDNGLYRPGIYLLAKMIDEVVVAVLCTAVFSTLMWYLISFEGSIIYLWAVYFGHFFNGIAMAYTCAAAAPDVNVANALLQTSCVILGFFSGLFILPDDMPVYWGWIYWIDYAAYGYSAVMVNQFEDQDDELAAGISLDRFSVFHVRDLPRRCAGKISRIVTL